MQSENTRLLDSLHKKKSNISKLTERILGDDRAECLQRLRLAFLVQRLHAELVLVTRDEAVDLVKTKNFITTDYGKICIVY